MSDGRRTRRRLWAMLLASLVLHAALALWLARLDGAHPVHPGRRATAVELEVRWSELARAETVPTTPPPPARPTLQPLRTGAVARTAPAAAASAPPEPSPVAEAPAGVPVPKALLDAPTAARPSLVPGAGFVRGLESGLDDELPKGTTVGNTPADLPDPVAMREYQGDALRRTLDTQLKQDLAQAETGAGRVAPYFHALEVAFRERAGARGVRRSPPGAQETTDLARKTLVMPRLSPEGARRLADSALGRSVAMQTVPLPDVESQRARESALQSLAMSEAIRERLEEPTLTTVLAITLDATGAIADASVEATSSDPTFDDSALQLSRAAVRELPELDAKGLGTSWWRTRWRFSWAPAGVRVQLLDAVPVESSLR